MVPWVSRTWVFRICSLSHPAFPLGESARDMIHIVLAVRAITADTTDSGHRPTWLESCLHTEKFMDKSIASRYLQSISKPPITIQMHHNDHLHGSW